jgi:hypothetical protein
MAEVYSGRYGRHSDYYPSETEFNAAVDELVNELDRRKHMSVRAKFNVGNHLKDDYGNHIVRLYAVWDDGIEENKRYAQATPSGMIELTITNPPAAEFFAAGKSVYVDFTSVA